MGTVDFQVKMPLKCSIPPHFLVTKMPYSIPSNATLYHRKCHTLCLLKCGISDDKVWRFKSFL